jgi:hypothetical protein
MNHKALYTLYPNAVRASDTDGAFDADGNQVTIDMDAVNAWVDSDQYKYDRKSEYDALNQFELMTDDAANSTTTHADAVEAVKTKWPKDNSGPIE